MQRVHNGRSSPSANTTLPSSMGLTSAAAPMFLTTQSTSPRRCRHCKKEFTFGRTVRRHERGECEKNPLRKMLTCEKCSAEFGRSDVLYRHAKKCQVGSALKNSKWQVQQPSTLPATPKAIYYEEKPSQPSITSTCVPTPFYNEERTEASDFDAGSLEQAIQSVRTKYNLAKKSRLLRELKEIQHNDEEATTARDENRTAKKRKLDDWAEVDDGISSVDERMLGDANYGDGEGRFDSCDGEPSVIIDSANTGSDQDNSSYDVYPADPNVLVDRLRHLIHMQRGGDYSHVSQIHDIIEELKIRGYIE